MSKLGVQNPISAGQYMGGYSATAVSDTNWHTLTSSDFVDTVTGVAFADGLKFAFLEIRNGSTTLEAHYKLRAADAPTDGKTNTDGVIPIQGGGSADIQGLANGGSVTSIAYAKAAAGDTFTITAGFNK